MIKTLIIGGTGYLGRHLYNVLIETRNEVYITSRINNNIKNCFVFDLTDINSYENIDFKSFDRIFMLASTMEGIDSKIFDENTFEINCNSYKNFLNHLVKINFTNHLIYVSSMTVYSVTNEIPVRENGCTELPPNSYGLSKLIAENLTKYYSKENNFKAIIIRIPGLFGSDRKSGFIYNAVEKISKNLNFSISTENLKYWEAISVLDASSMIKVLTDRYNWKKDYEIYNISYGHEIDITDLAYFIKEYLKSNSNIESLSPKGYVPFFLCNRKFLNLTNNYSSNFKDSLLDYINSILK